VVLSGALAVVLFLFFVFSLPLFLFLFLFLLCRRFVLYDVEQLYGHVVLIVNPNRSRGFAQIVAKTT